MIRTENGNIEFKGSPDIILSEIALLLNQAVERIAKQTSMSTEQIEGDIIKMKELYHLVDSGMNIQEAGEVVGLRNAIKGVKFNSKASNQISKEQLVGTKELD